MSHQPSQLEQATAKASEAYEAVSNKLMQAERKGDGGYDADRDPANFGYDTGGNKVRKGGLKEQLDDKAIGASSQRKEETLVEKGKVKSCIPGPSSSSTSAETRSEAAPDVPPVRPDHDVQVEEFLRGQYHSRSGDGNA
ncbi:hypothetical protein B0O99DRAFT_684201 [Bisporella sp. PMI_857]|nr:hypothetical protein B0O99DRAFT_684201 [Bisporella sp. PMI_857]